MSRCFSPSLCKALRNLLEWDQKDLANASGVSLSTIKFFESTRAIPKVSTIDKLQRSFNDSGIAFEFKKNKLIITMILDN